MSRAAVIYLAMGSWTVGVDGGTPAQCRFQAVTSARATIGAEPTAVAIAPRGRGHRWQWFGRSYSGARWRAGGWCPGCVAWSPRHTGPDASAHCSCGAALWLCPSDPGEAFPRYYAQMAQRGRGGTAL